MQPLAFWDCEFEFGRGEYCLLSGRGLCLGLITHPEDFYRVCCGLEWSCSLDNEDALAH